jgi:hypothetical protein
MRIMPVARTGAASQDGTSCSTEPWSWSSKRQSVTAISSTESEFYADETPFPNAHLTVYLRRMLD